MKYYKPIFLLACAFLLWNCASFKAKKQEDQLNIPKLGAIIKTKGGIWYEAAEQIGVPDWDELHVTVQEVPFNIDSYVVYAKHMQRAGKINSIPYNDSLRYKPKYVRLQLQDKIGLTKLLNDEAHNEIRNYLSLDKDHRLVSNIDIGLTETDIQLFLDADVAMLKKDAFGGIFLSLRENGQESEYKLNGLPIFSYGLSAFCWGEDKFYNKRIQNIVSEEFKCPKSTYLDPSKIKSEKLNLKF